MPRRHPPLPLDATGQPSALRPGRLCTKANHVKIRITTPAATTIQPTQESHSGYLGDCSVIMVCGALRRSTSCKIKPAMVRQAPMILNVLIIPMEIGSLWHVKPKSASGLPLSSGAWPLQTASASAPRTAPFSTKAPTACCNRSKIWKQSGCPSEWIRVSVLSWHPILFP